MTAATETHELHIRRLRVGQIVTFEDDLEAKTDLIVVDTIRSTFRHLHHDVFDPAYSSDPNARFLINVLGVGDGVLSQSIRPGDRLHCRYTGGEEFTTRPITHVSVDGRQIF